MAAAFRHLALLAIAGAPWLGAAAQPVYKCEVGGKVVYQAEPCAAGRTSTVRIDAGPTDEQVAQARARAQKEKSAADAAVAAAGYRNAARAAANAPVMPSLRAGGAAGGDCSALGNQFAQASSRRNIALGNARRGGGVTAGSAEDAEIARRQMEVASIVAAMQARGCGPR